MKSIQKYFTKALFFCSFIFFLNSFGQAPNLMSYQAVVRNGSNALVTNSNISMRISVLQGTASGTAVFVETQTATTNANGLATLKIGGGTVVTGSFSTIDWALGPYFIKTETDPTGGTSYSIAATSQLMSVPYALFAANSGTSSGSGTINYVSKFNTASTLGNSQIFDDGNGVGINNATPTSKFYVNGQGSIDVPLGDIQYTGGTNNNTRVGTISNNSVVTTLSNVGTYSTAGKAKNNVAFYGTTEQSGDPAAFYTGALIDNYNNNLNSTGYVSGIFNDVGNLGTGSAYGIQNFVGQSGPAGNAIGINSNVSGKGKTTGIAMLTQSNGVETLNGIDNSVVGGPSGAVSIINGAFNVADGYGVSTGAINVGVGEAVADAFGALNVAEAIGAGKSYGSQNQAFSDAEGDAYGADISATGGSFAFSSTTNGKTIGSNVLTSGANTVPLTTVGVKVVNNNNDNVTIATSLISVANPAGYFSATGGSGQGVYGESVGKGFSNGVNQYGIGVTGVSRDGASANEYNVGLLGMASGATNTNIGIGGSTDGSNAAAGVNIAVYGSDVIGAANSYAGMFDGNVMVNGTFTSTGPKPFTIDNPMDPENKLLRHFAVEGPEVLNNYSGNITTDANGKAIVQLPNYFESINKDFRYQLTAIGTFAQSIISKEISNNQFEITTNVPNVKVSWQIMGVRNDAYMQKVNKMQDVEDKPTFMKGKYLTPAAYDKPTSMGAFYIPIDKNGLSNKTIAAEAIQHGKETMEKSKAMIKNIKQKIAVAKRETELKNNSNTSK